MALATCKGCAPWSCWQREGVPGVPSHREGHQVPDSRPHPFLCPKAKFEATVSSRKEEEAPRRTAEEERGAEGRTGGVGARQRLKRLGNKGGVTGGASGHLLPDRICMIGAKAARARPQHSRGRRVPGSREAAAAGASGGLGTPRAVLVSGPPPKAGLSVEHQPLTLPRPVRL